MEIKQTLLTINTHKSYIYTFFKVSYLINTNKLLNN